MKLVSRFTTAKAHTKPGNCIVKVGSMYLANVEPRASIDVLGGPGLGSYTGTVLVKHLAMGNYNHADIKNEETAYRRRHWEYCRNCGGVIDTPEADQRKVVDPCVCDARAPGLFAEGPHRRAVAAAIEAAADHMAATATTTRCPVCNCTDPRGDHNYPTCRECGTNLD